VGHRNNGHDRIGAASDQQVDGGIDVIPAAERRCRLQQDEHVGLVLLARPERAKQVGEDRDHRRVVGGEGDGTQERDVRAQASRDDGDLLVVGADDEPRDSLAGACGINRIRDEWPACQRSKILARDPLGAAARRNDAEDVQY
jgi:hypothetical protein